MEEKLLFYCIVGLFEGICLISVIYLISIGHLRSLDSTDSGQISMILADQKIVEKKENSKKKKQNLKYINFDPNFVCTEEVKKLTGCTQLFNGDLYDNNLTLVMKYLSHFDFPVNVYWINPLICSHMMNKQYYPLDKKIFETNKLFFCPVQVGYHWVSLLADYKNQRMSYFDSEHSTEEMKKSVIEAFIEYDKNVSTMYNLNLNNWNIHEYGNHKINRWETCGFTVLSNLEIILLGHLDDIKLISVDQHAYNILLKYRFVLNNLPEN